MKNLVIPQKTFVLIICIILALGFMNSCKKQNSIIDTDNPKPITENFRKNKASNETTVDIDLCEMSPIGRDNIKPETSYTELEDDNGFAVENGTVIIELAGRELRLPGVTATFRFCANNRLIAIEGSSSIPSPIDCISFGSGKGTEIGFFTGQFLNNNKDRYNLDFTLPDDRAFFVFAMRQNIGVEVCTNLDNPENRPIKLEIPGVANFEYLYLLDFTDPFYYIQFGDKKIAESASGIIPFEATQPIPEMEPFASRTYVSGTYPMYGVLNINGHLYTNVPSIVSMLAAENPFEFAATEGFKGGINGYFDLSLPIETKKKKDDKDNDNDNDNNKNDNGNNKDDGDDGDDDSNPLNDILSFNIPLGEASAALTAAPVNGAVITKAFFNTTLEPSNDWWPNFIPGKPYGELKMRGFVQSGGVFDFLMSGEIGLQTSKSEKDLVNCFGQFTIDNESLILRGELNGVNDGWAVQSEIGSKASDMSIEIPSSLTSGLAPDVGQEIEDLEKIVGDLNAQLKTATKNLNLELSLRGLRDQIPAIVAAARKKLEDGVKTGKAKAKKTIDKSQLCYKSEVYKYVCKRIDQAVQPFKNALNQLEAAVQPELTDKDARTKLEAALRNLASLKKVNVKITYKTKIGKWVGIGRWRKRICVNYTFKYTFTQEVLSNAQADLLLEAADNIQYIAPAKGVVFDLGEAISELPSIEVIETLKTLPVPELNAVGYIVELAPVNYKYYVTLGDQTYFKEFNPFDWESIVSLVVELMEETM